MKKKIFSGVQPTGNLHLGNYLGAIKNFVALQNEEDNECVYCVVDLHAITVKQDPKILKDNIRETTAAFLASGLDYKKSIIFNQSLVPAHSEGSWILGCIARMGWLNRMTQFKEKAGRDKEKASVGLYIYPILMAADILLYDSTHVPVGEDQKQHLELSRDIAQKFNLDFNSPDFLKAPEPLIQKNFARIMSLKDGTKKMSKSDPSDPEITPEEVEQVRSDAIIATGRSDYPNQVNNLIGFPYIFRGALDVRAKTINEDMKVAAANAIASLARERVPDEVVAAMGGDRPAYGKEYIIPSTFDPRLISVIPLAVAKAAIKSGVARKKR